MKPPCFPRYRRPSAASEGEVWPPSVIVTDVRMPDGTGLDLTKAIREQLPLFASFHALRTRKAGARRFIEFHLTVPGGMSVTESHALCDSDD